MGALEGRTAIVTGSSQGIGREVARRFAREGANLVVNGTGADPAALPSLVGEIERLGRGAVACPGSVAEPTTADALVAAALDTFGRLDVLVNVAGIVEPSGSSIRTISFEDWRQQIDVHLHGTFLTCRASVPHLIESGGTIVNTTSHAATGMFGGTGYAAGKGGVNSLTYALANDLRDEGVRVNAVAPGGRTRMSTGPEYVRTIESLRERGRLSDAMAQAALDVAPAELTAPAYTFLASDASAPVTGQVLTASGMYIGRWSEPGETFVAWREDTPEGGWTVEELAEFTASLRE